MLYVETNAAAGSSAAAGDDATNFDTYTIEGAALADLSFNDITGILSADGVVQVG
ncbi:hypothetical protein [uncultured Marivita sp.]|uniref:hypothetical protein n=1 Tax=uncultured Marivita sp. TaxID=888080 RepID=UPI0025D4704A|nr:hypothetical protein [uncultured Marivita sp.]